MKQMIFYGFAHFHVDTFCGDPKVSIGMWTKHVLWDGFIGTMFFDITGLPGRR